MSRRSRLSSAKQVQLRFGKKPRSLNSFGQGGSTAMAGSLGSGGRQRRFADKYSSKKGSS